MLGMRVRVRVVLILRVIILLILVRIIVTRICLAILVICHVGLFGYSRALVPGAGRQQAPASQDQQSTSDLPMAGVIVLEQQDLGRFPRFTVVQGSLL